MAFRLEGFIEVKSLLIYDFILHWIIFGIHSSIDSRIDWQVNNGEYRNFASIADYSSLVSVIGSLLLTCAFIGLWKNYWAGYFLFIANAILAISIDAMWGIRAQSPEMMTAIKIEWLLSGMIILYWPYNKRKLTSRCTGADNG